MTARSKEFEFFQEKNYHVLESKDFGEVIFGCPPGIVKEFTKRKAELPSHYVIPVRTFVRGKNNFDFEFIIYSFLFIRSKKSKIDIYCTAEQESRFKIILGETLFGPKFHHIIEAQFRRIAARNKFTSKETRLFDAFLRKIAADKKLFGLFSRLLKSHVSQGTLSRTIKEYFENMVARHKWLLKRNIPNLTSQLTKHYILCAQLRKEMELFALAGEDKRDEFIYKTVAFHHFDEKNSVVVRGHRDKRKKLKIVQVQPSLFEIYRKERLIHSIDLSDIEPARKIAHIDPIEKPFMGVTFLGVGSGFTPERESSCLVAWMEGKGIMVDAMSESAAVARQYGIAENDVCYLFLSHVHSDHDIGIIEKTLHGKRVKVISTRIIFESFLRKVEAVTCFPKDVTASFFDFFEVEPHKPIKLPGFENSYFTFDYSLHSIPTGRFTLTYKSKGLEKKMSHSGDTKYDVEKINRWYEQGVFTRKRRDDLLGFIWDADLIIHDVGGGNLHTEKDALEHLDDSVIEKLVLVHQDQDPVAHSKFNFAVEGQTCVLIKENSTAEFAPLETVRQVTLFSKLKQHHLLELLAQSEIRRYKDNEIVFSQNEVGNSFYVILDGFADIIINGKPISVYEKGNFFGELAIATKNPLRRATVKAKGPLTLLKIDKKYYKKFNLPSIRDDFYKLGNYFSEIISPSLLASLAFGKIVRWNKNDVIINYRALDTDLYVILSGQVEVLDKENKSIAFLSSGDIVGEIACLKNVPRTATIRARSKEVCAVRLRRSHVKKMLQLFPSFHGTVYQKIKKLEASFM